MWRRTELLMSLRRVTKLTCVWSKVEHPWINILVFWVELVSVCGWKNLIFNCSLLRLLVNVGLNQRYYSMRVGNYCGVWTQVSHPWVLLRVFWGVWFSLWGVWGWWNMKFNCLLFWIVFNIGQKHWCWKLAFVLVQRERVQLNLSLVYFGWQWIVILYIFLLQPSVLSIFVWGMCWPKWISIRLC